LRVGFGVTLAVGLWVVVGVHAGEAVSVPGAAGTTARDRCGDPFAATADKTEPVGVPVGLWGRTKKATRPRPVRAISAIPASRTSRLRGSAGGTGGSTAVDVARAEAPRTLVGTTAGPAAVSGRVWPDAAAH
jgi:hypothetical protein